MSVSWVWLPGWSLSTHLWNPTNRILYSLSDRIAASKQYFINFSEGYPLWEQVNHQIHETAPVVLVGWSMGGFVALEWACRYPSRVAGLVLGAVGPYFPLQPRNGWTSLLRQAERNPGRLLQKFDHQLFSLEEQKWGAREHFQRELRTSNAQPTQQSLVWGLRYLQQISFSREQLAAIRSIPIHLHTGQEDTIVPPRSTQKLTLWLPRAKYKVWDAAGHLACWSQPKEMAVCLHQLGEEVGSGEGTSHSPI
ncbi:alpha/beta fold hydrolase [Pasteuria penetrans]|uniref:alpha/beta fold hydrolase n=1 Tax=Pasteuria penetrans TaxID=86005 RepID=UPI000FBD2DA1|nr:alpha/beta hydrolase [Pasteuria penetrans]